MPAQKGYDMLLSMDATVIAGARTHTFTVNNNPVDVTTKTQQGIEEMLADAGIQQLTIAMDGLFENTAKEIDFQNAALNRTVHSYELAFANGSKYTANMVIEDYTRGGAHDDAETFSATLRRTGTGTLS